MSSYRVWYRRCGNPANEIQITVAEDDKDAVERAQAFVKKINSGTTGGFELTKVAEEIQFLTSGFREIFPNRVEPTAELVTDAKKLSGVMEGVAQIMLMIRRDLPPAWGEDKRFKKVADTIERMSKANTPEEFQQAHQEFEALKNF